MYLMLGSRPDLAFAVGKLARFCENPRQKHWTAVKRIFRYLSGSREMGLVFRRDCQLGLIGYSDSDWAGDLGDRKSTGGFVFSMSGAPVSWSSRKQTIVAASSCEAEYIALCACSKESIWLRRVVQDVLSRRLGPVDIYSDIQGAIALAQNKAPNRRNKHIDIQYHFVRDAVRRQEVQLDYVPTDKMLADIMTKPVGAVLFQRLVTQMGVTSKGEL